LKDIDLIDNYSRVTRLELVGKSNLSDRTISRIICRINILLKEKGQRKMDIGV